MNTQNEPKYNHAHNYPFSQDTLMQAIIDLGKQLKESEHQLSVSNEKNKRSVAQISILEDKLMNSQDSAVYWQERHRLMHEEYKEEFRINSELNKKLIDANEKNSSLELSNKLLQDSVIYWKGCYSLMHEKYKEKFLVLNKSHKELSDCHEAAECDNERLIDALLIEQNKNKTLENKIIELSTKEIKNPPEVKQVINLTQSEIDFLKKYLSNCITESQEDIDLLKDTAKAYKGAVKNSCYKGADKLQKKLKVLSVIQHKLKKTVLSRNEQKYYFSPDEYGMRWWNRALSTEEVKTLTENPWQIFEQRKPEDDVSYKNAWYSVVDALDAAHPCFFQQDGIGEQCAVKAILKLGKDSQRLKELKEMLNKA